MDKANKKLIFSKLFLTIAGLLGVFLITSGSQADNNSPDAIAIRVIPNPEHYSAARWYALQNFSGSPQSLTVDEYEAVRDGRTVYVNAANVIDTNNNSIFGDTDIDRLYTNIYVISYNQEAESATTDIFGQIIMHWKFNHNIIENGQANVCSLAGDRFCRNTSDCQEGEYCRGQKAMIVRDTKRLSDMAEMKIILNDYKTANASYPDLAAGTYLPNISISAWPSWQDALGSALGQTLPIDPVNKLQGCPPDFDPATCWDEKNKKYGTSTDPFQLPESSSAGKSLAYVYIGNSFRSEFSACAVMESGLVVTEKDGACQQSVRRSGEIANQYNRIDAVNLPPVDSGHEFTGYLEGTDQDSDRLRWTWDSAQSDWLGNKWSAIPTLSASKVSRIRTLHADRAGRKGTYYFSVTIDDLRGKDNSRTVRNYKLTVNNYPPALTNEAAYVFAASSTGKFSFSVTAQDDPLNFPLTYDFATRTIAAIPGIEQTWRLSGSDTYSYAWNGMMRPIYSISGGSSVYNSSGYYLPQSIDYDFTMLITDHYDLTSTSSYKFNIINHAPVFQDFACAPVHRRFTSYPECVLPAADEDNNRYFYEYDFGALAGQLAGTVMGGRISGTPSTRGTTTLNVTVKDEFGASSAVSFPIRIDNWCGDGITDGDWQSQNANDEGFLEQCDDGNSINDDNCDNICRWTCASLAANSTAGGEGTDLIKETNNGGAATIQLYTASATPYLWAPNTEAGTISKIRTADGRKRVCSQDGGQIVCSWENTIERKGQVVAGPISLSQNDDLYSPSPSRVAVNNDTGEVWVANRDSKKVMKLDNNGVIKKTCATQLSPMGLVLDLQGNAWVAESDWINENASGTTAHMEGHLVEFPGDDANCTIMNNLDIGGHHPTLALDADNNIWVANRWADRVQKVSKNASGQYVVYNYPLSTSACGVYGQHPDGLIADFEGRIWVADTCHGAWQVSPTANNQVQISYINLGTGLNNASGQSRDLAVDINGSIYVSMDLSNQITKIINPANPGQYIQLGNANGTGVPIGVIGDASGQIWSINYNTNNATVLNPLGQATVGSLLDQDAHGKPYAHGDLTGFNRGVLYRKGTWSKTFDGINAGQHWGKILYDLNNANNAKMGSEVYLRAGNDIGLAGEEWVSSTQWNNYPLWDDRRAGRYLQIKAELDSHLPGKTPVISNLRIECTTCSEWTYGGYGACYDGKKYRPITSFAPAGCSGGNPYYYQECTKENNKQTGKEYVYITEMGSDTVSLVDTTDNSIQGRFEVGSSPQHLAYNSVDRNLYITVFGGNKIEVINTTNQDMAEMPVEGMGKMPIGITISEGNKLIVTTRGSDGRVSNDDRVDIIEINSATFPPTAHLVKSLATGLHPIKSAVKNGKAVVTARNQPAILIIDLASNSIIKTFNLPNGSEPEGVVAHPGANIVYVGLHGTSKIDIVDLDSLSIIKEVDLPANSRPSTIDITPQGDRMYVAGQDSHLVYSYNISNPRNPVRDNSVALDVGVQPHFISFLDDGRAYVANTNNTSGKGSVSIINNYATNPSVAEKNALATLVEPLWMAKVHIAELKPTRIYLTYVSQNERDPHEECTSVVTTKSGYENNRSATVDLVNMIKQKGAALSFQTDWQYISAAQKWDSTELKSNTGGLDVIKWIGTTDPAHISVEAHAHEDQGTPRYNLADVVNWIVNQEGLPDQRVVGGFTFYPASEQDWTKFREPYYGNIYSIYRWQAGIMWGASEKNNAGNNSSDSGIWRPQDANNFYKDDRSQNLVYVGGQNMWDQMLEKLNNAQLMPGHMYTETQFISQCAINDNSLDTYSSQIDQVAGEVKKGNMVWATLPEMVRVWREEYESVPTIYQQENSLVTIPEQGLCGDHNCDGAENITNCPADCTSSVPDVIIPGQGSCGDHTCEGPENITNCPADCASSGGGTSPCGDNVCEGPENKINCPADCK